MITNRKTEWAVEVFVHADRWLVQATTEYRSVALEILLALRAAYPDKAFPVRRVETTASTISVIEDPAPGDTYVS